MPDGNLKKSLDTIFDEHVGRPNKKKSWLTTIRNKEKNESIFTPEMLSAIWEDYSREIEMELSGTAKDTSSGSGILLKKVRSMHNDGAIAKNAPNRDFAATDPSEDFPSSLELARRILWNAMAIQDANDIDTAKKMILAGVYAEHKKIDSGSALNYAEEDYRALKNLRASNLIGSLGRNGEPATSNQR